MGNPEEEPSTTYRERGLVPLIREIYRIWIGERPGLFAAAMAYYALFSFVPIIYVAITVAGIFIDELALIEQLVARVSDKLGAETAQQLAQALDTVASGASGGTPLTAILGFVAMLFAASLMFFQLQHALNTVWHLPPPTRGETQSYIRNRLLAFVMVLGVGLLFLLATAVNILVTAIDSLIELGSSLPIGNVVAVVLLATLTLAIIYKVLPNAQVAWRDVLVGSTVTAVLITLGGFLLGLYLGASRVGSALEAAGAVAVFLMAFYFFGSLFVFGAVFTRVYAGMFGSGIVPRE